MKKITLMNQIQRQMISNRNMRIKQSTLFYWFHSMQSKQTLKTTLAHFVNIKKEKLMRLTFNVTKFHFFFEKKKKTTLIV
jgi:hypothetical protein